MFGDVGSGIGLIGFGVERTSNTDEPEIARCFHTAMASLTQDFVSAFSQRVRFYVPIGRICRFNISFSYMVTEWL